MPTTPPNVEFTVMGGSLAQIWGRGEPRSLNAMHAVAREPAIAGSLSVKPEGFAPEQVVHRARHPSRSTPLVVLVFSQVLSMMASTASGTPPFSRRICAAASTALSIAD